MAFRYLFVSLSMGTVLLSMMSIALFVVFSALVAPVSVFRSTMTAVGVVFLAVFIIVVVFLVMPIT